MRAKEFPCFCCQGDAENGPSSMLQYLSRTEGRVALVYPDPKEDIFPNLSDIVPW
ncbi:rCG40942 [Rattus norvegicus]|uniref:RCG40942 n=1 Tax=Rattus norvegicus TaxID=10116 RepID=A6KMQ9_RAT|nr:rCG40942 [Rattus norvegicus]